MPERTRIQPPEADARPGMTDDEAALVARAVTDRAAFAPLYARYVGPVYRYCHRRLGSREAAEDATSLIFMKALAALPRYRASASFRSWLFAIAHNVVADAHRRARPDRPLEAAGDPPDDALTPEELALVTDERRVLAALLRRLPPSQQEVVALRLSGLTHVEIAEAVGRSHAAVRTLQSRALTRLRKILAEDAPREEEDDAE